MEQQNTKTILNNWYNFKFISRSLLLSFSLVLYRQFLFVNAFTCPNIISVSFLTFINCMIHLSRSVLTKQNMHLLILTIKLTGHGIFQIAYTQHELWTNAPLTERHKCLRAFMITEINLTGWVFSMKQMCVWTNECVAHASDFFLWNFQTVGLYYMP